MLSSARVGWLVLFASLVLTAGCGTNFGPCDEAQAKTLVYDTSGLPAYEGQAVLDQSCGHGAFCHSHGATGQFRFGAPAGLDFDVAAACGDSTSAATCDKARAVFATVHRTTLDYDWDIDSQIGAGRMPPGGKAGQQTAPVGTGYTLPDPTHTPVPVASSPEGRAVLRNWFACGAPVVERTTDRPHMVGDVVPSGPPTM